MAVIINRLLNSGPYYLRKHAADAKVVFVAIDDEWFGEVWIRECDCILEFGLYCSEGAFAIFCPLELALFD